MKIIALGLLLFAPLWLQDDIFRSGVSLVRLDAEVADATGRIITGLEPGDFIVRDNGAPQQIVNFSFEQEPLDLILLFDTSGKMRGQLSGVVRSTELGFHELRKGDRVCVMAFSNDVTEAAPFTEDLAAVNEAILVKVLAMKFGGTSKIETAADKAALRFRKEPETQRRRAILAITDNAGSRTAEQSLVRDLWTSDAVFAELLVGRPAVDSPIADKTGGSVISVGPANPGAAFQESLRRLRNRYTLYYRLPQAAPGSQRTVQVDLTPEASSRFPKARIYSRTGYVVPPAQ